MALFSEREQGAITADEVFRPINYLGAKSRSLATILSVIADRCPAEDSKAADLFAGTTVVSQGLARMGFNVVASDALNISSIFARALLGIAKPEPVPSAGELFEELAATDVPTLAAEAFETWREREEEAVAATDGEALIEILRKVPQVWRSQQASELQQRLFQRLRKQKGKNAFEVGGLTVSYYGGTYFGVDQALDIDRIRLKIARAKRSGQIGAWEEAVLLTALLSAASEVVYSPGKHFAQYHSVRSDKDLTFQRKRILQDRSLSLKGLFKDRTRSVLRYAAETDGRHRALHAPLEAFLEDPHPLDGCDLIYADPPYTAQQYSRFYHIPEQLGKYEVPELQIHRGSITKGLYPAEKHKSRFCSKRKAPAAFRDLVALADRVSADLAVSYAEVASGGSGNARMIDLKPLLKILATSRADASVEVFELNHNYRQFNRLDTAKPDRRDRELILYRSRS